MNSQETTRMRDEVCVPAGAGTTDRNVCPTGLLIMALMVLVSGVCWANPDCDDNGRLCPRMFAVVPVEVWEGITSVRKGTPTYADNTGDARGLSEPRFSPTYEWVLIDKPGNVDFSKAEREYLKGRGAEFIPADKIQAWLRANKWGGRDEG